MRDFVNEQTLLHEDAGRVTRIFETAMTAAARARRRPASAKNAADSARSRDAGTPAVRLAVAGGLRQLSGFCDALLHGGNSRSRSARRHASRGGRGDVERRKIWRVARGSFIGHAAGGVPFLCGVFGNFLKLTRFSGHV